MTRKLPYLLAMTLLLVTGLVRAVEVRGRIVDSTTGGRLPARLYVVDENGKTYDVRSGSKDGSAVVYRKQRGKSLEHHTSLSAHDFLVDLPNGEYTLTAERGKEYLTAEQKIRVAGVPLSVRIELARFADMAKLGWYSGETHVHRPIDELPTLLLAEDLNVAFPLTYWVTKAYEAPRTAGAQPIDGRVQPNQRDDGKWTLVDKTHAIYPRNTEYEIFTVGGKRHTLGAVFLIRHKTIFDKGVPPVAPIAKKAHAEGALLELDKHNWPWSMAIIPVMKVDLYELTNNHIWRTDFLFKGWAEQPAAYMNLQSNNELGWIHFGLQNYYALVNCGFRMRPTAGTASGVHPVPLGYGRVYVEMRDGFDPDKWLEGLDAGRSFVTTGPLLMTTVNGKPGGHRFELEQDGEFAFHVRGECISALPLVSIEIVVNGEVARRIDPQSERLPSGANRTRIDASISVRGSTWVAVRVFSKRPNGRMRFAHSSPVFADVKGQPLRPRKVEVEYLVRRVRDQITRSTGVLPEAALAEYREALKAYESLLPTAR